NKYKPTFVAGSPAIWSRVADYGTRHQLTFPSIKYVVMFGAPISLKLHETLLPLLPNGNSFAPYGATEALPLTLTDGRWLLANTKERNLAGAGMCIGKAVHGVEIKI